MMLRKCRRRTRGLERSCPGANSNVADGISNSSSRGSQDVCDFNFPSQEFNTCGGLLKFKKQTVFEFATEPYGSDSFKTSKEFEVLEIRDVNFLESKKLKKISHIPFEYSKDSKNVGPDPNMLNSSNKLVDFGVAASRKRRSNRTGRELNGVSGTSKTRDSGECGCLQLNRKKKMTKAKEPESGYEVTNTLMETQEVGEVMKHADEFGFTLGGLKKGGSIKVRRACLLSLLTICGTMQQGCLMRANGMANHITDAILGLSLDDVPSNLAAATLFYILTCDGQGGHVLCPPNCIHFLIKLLNPSTATDNERQPIGRRLLGLQRSAGFSRQLLNESDSSSTAITCRVWEILIKEMKSKDGGDDAMEDIVLNPKWISLLMMERACQPRMAVEGGILQKTGFNFTEKLREFGGLDVVFEVTRKCYFLMEEWLQKSPSYSLDLKDNLGPESLVLLLKCLKVMENVAMHSIDNQCYLLWMKGCCESQQAPRSFTKLIISIVKILSGVSLLRSSFKSYEAESNHLGMLDSNLENARVPVGSQLIMQRRESSQSGSCSGTFGNSEVFETKLGKAKKRQLSTKSGTMECTWDPSAFKENQFEQSKWDFLSGHVTKSTSRNSTEMLGKCNDRSFSPMISSHKKSNNKEYHRFQESSCLSAVVADKSALVDDCLLTAVKVLINLTNNCPEGCQQVAAHGGLEISSSLIAGHFPSIATFSQFDDVCNTNQQGNTSLTDQELDFLVAILSLLINLVWKDDSNRSRLATTSVLIPSVEHLDSQRQTNVISLLCWVFLANRGNIEVSKEDLYFSWEDEAGKTILEAYSALLLAFLTKEGESVCRAIGEWLPNHNLTTLVPVLEQFATFHVALNMMSPEIHGVVDEVIEWCRIWPQQQSLLYSS